MAQTKWQLAYGIRRTWANKLERQAKAIRVGDLAKAQQIEEEIGTWAVRKYREMTGQEIPA